MNRKWTSIGLVVVWFALMVVGCTGAPRQQEPEKNVVRIYDVEPQDREKCPKGLILP